MQEAGQNLVDHSMVLEIHDWLAAGQSMQAIAFAAASLEAAWAK